MNDHRASGNEQATAPAMMPVKNNNLGTAMAPMRNNTLGAMASPTGNNTLGTAVSPTGSNTLGATSPEKKHMPTATSPMTTGKPDNMQQVPVLSEMMPSKKHKAQHGYYQPGGMLDYPEATMGQTGYYPPAVPQTGMFPSSMPQTGMMPSVTQPMDVMAPTAPRSIFQPQPPQGMMPQNGTQRTSIMTSGIGVRNSVLSSTDFTQGFLQTQIGRHVKVEFLLGTNMLVDREGDLVKVGTDYIIIQETETDDYLLCDIYSIRFIRFYY